MPIFRGSRSAAAALVDARTAATARNRENLVRHAPFMHLVGERWEEAQMSAMGGKRTLGGPPQ